MQAQRFNTIQLTFDTDQNCRVPLPLFRYPDCVKDYRLEYRAGTVWKTLVEMTENYVRRGMHRFDALRSDRLRLTVLATNGAASARVYEVRIYHEAVGDEFARCLIVLFSEASARSPA